MTDYEIVVGIETHVELDTKTKIFCSCEIDGFAPPNARVCPVCMGFPGALPALNENAVTLAVRAGLTLNCAVARVSAFDRKHYFYPDLPKGYQITQFDAPLCVGGGVTLPSGKYVPLTRIHIEEDAGKLFHEGDQSLVDFNRCGVPLIEIVSEPVLSSGDEAADYLRTLRDQLIYAGVTKGRMNEGHLRADVNLSIRKKGENILNERTEIKNLNSFQSVKRAIESEFARQVSIVQSGGIVRRETLKFDQATGEVGVMRRKESSADYRYMPEPNLPPLLLTDDMIARIRAEMPDTLAQRQARYLALGLTPYAAEQILLKKETADALDAALEYTRAPVALANLYLSSEEELTASPVRLGALADMLENGEISSGAGKKILQIICQSDIDPRDVAAREGLLRIDDEAVLREAAQKALASRPDLVKKYLSGKDNAFRALMGAAMGETGGRGDPRRLTDILTELLAQKKRD